MKKRTDVERKVGIYVRLSKEDIRSGESMSIENQKYILTKQVYENNWMLVGIYEEACDIIEPTQKASNIKGF